MVRVCTFSHWEWLRCCCFFSNKIPWKEPKVAEKVKFVKSMRVIAIKMKIFGIHYPTKAKGCKTEDRNGGRDGNITATQG